MNHAECNVHNYSDAKNENDFYANLIRTYGGTIYATAYRITKNPEDAEDVLQDVFLRLLKKKKRLSGEGEWGLYLRKIAVNAAIDLLRQRTRRQETPLDETIAESLRSMQYSPDAILIHEELLTQIQSKIARLPKMEATVFILRHFEGLSYQEIAEVTGNTKNAVGVALHSARQKLMKSLASYLKPQPD